MSQILNILSDIRRDYQNNSTHVTESETDSFPSDSVFAACHQNFGSERFDRKYCTTLIQDFKRLWFQWRVWVFELVVLLIFLGSAKEVLDDILYVPSSSACPAFNSSAVPTQYS